MPGWNLGLLGFSVYSLASPKPHHNYCVYQGTRGLMKSNVVQKHLVAQAHPRSFLGRKNAAFQCPINSQKSDSPVPYPLSSLGLTSQASPRMPSEHTSVHAQKALYPCCLHQAIYPRSRSQKGKLVVNRRLYHNPLAFIQCSKTVGLTPVDHLSTSLPHTLILLPKETMESEAPHPSSGSPLFLPPSSPIPTFLCRYLFHVGSEVESWPSQWGTHRSPPGALPCLH